MIFPESVTAEAQGAYGAVSNKAESKTRTLLNFWVILFIFLLSACGDEKSPDEQVRQFVMAGKVAAEERDVLAIRDLVSASYRDASSRDRRSLVGLATGYFLRHKNVYLFTQLDTIAFPAPGESHVQVFVAMAGSPVTGVQALLDMRANLYKFDLKLLKERDEWFLQSAAWQRVGIGDLVED